MAVPYVTLSHTQSAPATVTVNSQSDRNDKRGRSIADSNQPEVLSRSVTGQRSPKRTANRGRPTLTPEEYARSIYAHSLRSTAISSFPGNNYSDLAKWLSRAYTQPQSKSTVPFHLIALYDLGDLTGDCSWFYNEDDINELETASRPGKDQVQLLFIRGFLSPTWISLIGSKYGIDPEFLLRHLDFFSTSPHRHLYSNPSLISTTNNITQLCVTTIFREERSPGGNNTSDDMISSRKDQAEKLSAYKRLLRVQACSGDSMVRQYYTLDQQYFIMEQWISITIVKSGDGWLGLVWMDQGRNLESSLRGPWTSELSRNATAFPVIQHHPKMTTRKTHNGTIDSAESESEAPQLRPPPSPSLSAFQQSGTLLPLEYDSILSLADLRRRCSFDVAIGLLPIFVHAAFSENHFLNLMDSEISKEVDALATEDNFGSISNLQFLLETLERHQNQLRNSVRAVGNLFDANRGPSVKAPGQKPPMRMTLSSTSSLNSLGDEKEKLSDQDKIYSIVQTNSFSPKGVMDDYNDLLQRTQRLCERCVNGIEITMNKTMVLESRRAIEQNERVKKLSLLATLFIPLTFSTSVFGMNLEILGQGHVAVWWFFVFAGPVILSAYVFWIWDAQRIFNIWTAYRVKVKKSE
ncbi:hypothetical protein B0J11DRAFT_592653 [Dendryphion nanum]|uniref:Uncharacterized protein n=1 Tax=Dendryphion nanum TaxID=256645 RepID=A0A9P9ICP5_9PLEO|nr:hypothetical protein B0J11DRAFT_592653 [Dendryphion nanum]